jgi:hypothetical protein
MIKKRDWIATDIDTSIQSGTFVSGRFGPTDKMVTLVTQKN